MNQENGETFIRFHLAKLSKKIPRYNSQIFTTEINSEILKISFLSLDNLLQRQFYKFCSPVLLRELFLVSKVMKEIKCPPAYVSCDTVIYTDSAPCFGHSEKPNPSVVIEIRREIELLNINSGDISEHFPYCIFHHKEVDISNSTLNPDEFKVIFNPNITHFDYEMNKAPDDFNLASILERMPYLETLNFDVNFEVPNLVSTLFNWEQKSKLKKLFLHCPSIDNLLQNPELIIKFMKRQKSDFIMELDYPDVSGPTPLPLVGNLITIVNNLPGYGAFEAWKKSYGPVYTYWLATNPIVAISDFKLIQETFVKDGEAYAGRGAKGAIPTLIRGGDYGVVFTDGSSWRDQRRFAMTVLKNLGMGRNIIEEKILLEYDQLHDDLLTELGSSAKAEMNIGHHIEVTVASVINQLLFGFAYHEKTQREEFSKLKDVLSDHMTRAIDPLIFMVAQMPFLKNIPPFRSAFSSFLQGYLTITDYCNEQIQKHKEKVSESDEPRDFIEAYLLEMAKSRNPDFTEIQLLNVIYDIWIAGQETTANTLIFAVLYCLHNPEKQRLVQKELDTVIGSRRRITSADRHSLPYLSAFINETQRMVNLLPQNLIHRTTKEVTVNGYRIPEGTDILPQISTVLYDAEIFPNPMEFRPERFLDAEGNLKKVEELIPFSVGKRQCLGESLARNELYLLAANLFNNFEVLPVDEGHLPSLNKKHGVTIQPEKFTCIVRKRL